MFILVSLLNQRRKYDMTNYELVLPRIHSCSNLNFCQEFWLGVKLH